MNRIKQLKLIVAEAVKSATKVKTLYVFDFDHTIAHTIEERFKLPDGRVDLAAFSGLSDETSPNEPIFSLFQSHVAADPDTTYILTARPVGVKKPMIKWLEKHDIDIDPSKLIFLGNSAPNKKRDWIMSKVLEISAKKVIFWDDREKNVKAVQSLSDIKKYPDMQGIKVEAILV